MLRVAGSVFLATMVAAGGVAGAQSLNTSRVLAQATLSPSTADAAAAEQAAPPNQVASADANGYTAAPVPDSDDAPVAKSTDPGQPEWRPSLFRPGGSYRGEGFVPGSSVQASQQRNTHPAPGISLNVPLQ